MSTALAIAAALLATGSGLPALLGQRQGNGGQRTADALLCIACVLGFVAGVGGLAGSDDSVSFALGALLPDLRVGLDPLAAAFLLPVCALGLCAAVYDLGYWPQHAHSRGGRQLRLFLGPTLGGMIALLLAQDGLSFLMAWEVMALSAFFLVGVESQHASVRAASWIYLAATHLATLLLVAFFALWWNASGSLSLATPAAGIGEGPRNALFLLALCGFGIKAGIVPLHFWLPPAHASAPSHVSALMSGALIKMGVYGVLRVLSLLPAPPPWWGTLLLGIGATSAVVGVALAIGQHDIKRLLAYHSIENIGIIFLGVGLVAAGRALDRPGLVALGITGAVLHVWNHALFKGLLFLAAGAVVHAVGTRNLDRLGGLTRRMPWTTAAFAIGAVAICALPPLNGLVSELLVYLGLFQALDSAHVAAVAIAIPALATAGALALLCFVKVLGTAFLGQPRTPAAERAVECGPSMRLPMLLLAVACAGVGVLPGAVLPAFAGLLRQWLPGPSPEPESLLPATAVGALAVAAIVLTASAWWWLKRRVVRSAAIGTWDCGYARPSPRIQYTASSFAQLFVEQARPLLLPHATPTAEAGLFPHPQQFHSAVQDPVLDRALLPCLRGASAVCQWLRLLQRGKVQLYLLYILITLLVLLFVP